VNRVTQIFLVLIVVVILGDGVARVDAEAVRTADKRNIDALMKYLRPVLKPVGGAARIYYVGTCYRNGDVSVFPRLKLQPPSNGAVGLVAVRKIIQNDKRVTVAKDQSGIIRINIGRLPSPILQTKIRSLKLKPEEQYTDLLALQVIEKAKEVDAAVKPGEDAFNKRGGGEVVVSSILVQTPTEGFPHLPAVMKNVTLDRALDSVAQTFGDIVTYEEWRGPAGALHVSFGLLFVIGYVPSEH
jgi:hypothetical protein